MSAWTFSVVISLDEDDSIDLLTRTIQAFLAQKGLGERVSTHLNVWCGSGAGMRVREALCQETARAVRVVDSPSSFLSALPQSLSIIEQQNTTHVILVRCGCLPRPECIAQLLGATDIAGVVITACGYRLFPHAKLSSPLTDLKECVHYKFYSESHTTREVHIFTTDFCCIEMPVLKSIAEKHSEQDLGDVSSFAHIWCSFVVCHSLGLSIWKHRMERILDLSAISPLCTTLIRSAVNDVASFEKFYQFSYDSNWPTGIAELYYSREKMEPAKENRETCGEIWERGFAGVNMLSEPASCLDFSAAVSCGVRVIRIGAVGGAKDLMYLVDMASTSAEEDKAHLLKVLPRLRRSLIEIGDHGMKTIITVVDLPGCPFFSLCEDQTMTFWESEELRFRARKFWGVLAEHLVDLRHIIMGYDLINEPFTQEDREVTYFQEIPTAHADTLNDFYRKTVSEIRIHDKDTPIILKCTWYAAPIAMEMLQPVPDDPHIKYGFHCYIPPHLTLHREPDPNRKYPGHVPLFCRAVHSETMRIDKSYIREFLTRHVVSWQKKYSVPSHQMCVAEFGICREVPGAQQYLTDLVAIFSEFDWSWLLFSYRDEEWDALDYELGPLKANMLYRSNCDMFLSVAKHFR